MYDHNENDHAAVKANLLQKQNKILPNDKESYVNSWIVDINDSNNNNNNNNNDKSVIKNSVLINNYSNNIYKFNVHKNNKTTKRLWNVPWIIVAISLIQIFTFYYISNSLSKKLIFIPKNKLELWRFVSYAFLHLDYIHLWLNIIIQFLLALPLETEQGCLRVLIIYLFGAISGAMGSIIFQPKLLVVGASAGVYSLLISHVAHIVMNFHSLQYRVFRIVSVIFLSVSDIVHIALHFIINDNRGPVIGVAAHFSGALAGLLFGFIIFRGCKQGFFIWIKIITLFITIFIISVVIYYIFYRNI